MMVKTVYFDRTEKKAYWHSKYSNRNIIEIPVLFGKTFKEKGIDIEGKKMRVTIEILKD